METAIQQYTAAAGARATAGRVLVVMTDGQDSSNVALQRLDAKAKGIGIRLG